MTPTELSAAIAGLARVQARHADAVPDLSVAFGLLTALLEASTAPPPLPSRREGMVYRLVELERAMRHYESGQRRDAICERMGISRSYYYELRADAAERGRVP